MGPLEDENKLKAMGDKTEQEMAKEKILDVKPSPGDAEVKASQPLYKRRRFQLCCSAALGFIFLIGIIIIILVFAVFKPKDPDIRVNGVRLADLNITYGNNSSSSLPQVRLKVDLNITVHNPNRAAFKYTNSSAVIYYQEIEVGHADIPAGSLSAGGTATEVVTLEVQANKFLQSSNFTLDLLAGVIPVSSTTRLSGRVNVLNIYKRHAVSTTRCNMSVFVANATLASFQCTYNLKV